MSAGSLRIQRHAAVLICCVVFVWGGWFIFHRSGWTETRTGVAREWRKGNVTHIDENGDGVVDEEDALDPRTGQRTVRRDADRDGYFDFRYELNPAGVASHIRRIHEKAPRH